MKFEMDTSQVSDKGEEIGKSSGYINNFKKLGMGDNTQSPVEYKNQDSKIISLPVEWGEDTQKEILVHYYKKVGNGSCEDFDKVAIKISESINRAYKTRYLSTDIAELLKRKVTKEDFIKKQEELTYKNKEIKPVVDSTSKVKISLEDGKYDFIAGLFPLTKEQLDLCGFINKDNLCFSSDSYSFYLAVKPNKTKSFNNLFDFNANEKVMFEMFKGQNFDEHTARKLVLMLRQVKTPRRAVRKISSRPVEKIKKVSKKEDKKEDTTKKLF